MITLAKANNINKKYYNEWTYFLEKHGYQFKVDITIKPALMFELNNKKVINLKPISDGNIPVT